MYFLDTILSSKTKKLRSELITHALWQKIKNGTATKKQLGIFALQDYWLIKQARRIDGLTIAKVSDKQLQNLLIARLVGYAGQSSSHNENPSIFNFGRGVGLAKKDFEQVVPLAGCMALTTFFYWMIDYASDLEKVAAIFSSIGVFSDICMQVYQPLMQHYGLTEEQVTFFSGHKYSEGKVHPVSVYIESRCKTAKEKQGVDQAVLLSHEFEKMFYDTILTV